MKNILATAKVIVCVGSGGVGKTTVASAIAFQAAAKGRKVLVLTVDPSKRLKSTMGLNDNTDSLIQDSRITGELSASVIDPKKTFDEFVIRAAGKSASVEKLLKNKLYVQLSTTLNGSQEFTALEKLYSAYESGKYDLIVLDTPPTKHAIDFLEAPQKLSQLFNDKISSWFRDPEGGSQGFFRNLISAGTKQVLKALEVLTGQEFMLELTEFFKSIQNWQMKLEGRIGQVHSLLVDSGTHFVLVTSLDEAKLAEAQFFSREIKKGGYQLSTVIINRAFPKGLDLATKFDGSTELEQLYKKFQEYQLGREQSYLDFVQKMSAGRTILRLPELINNISDLEGVVEMANNIEQVVS